jgi:poly-gamma-glutamate synthesis protein (capsule biosynthesis protein)
MANVLSYFEQDDYSFVNLEGTLGDKGTLQNKKYRFRGSAKYTKVLTENSVEGVTLANNHSFDYGQEGLDETKRILEEAGVDFADHKETVLLTTDTGLIIGMYAVDFTREKPAEEEMQNSIQKLREDGAEIVVCAFHWGQENTFRINKLQNDYGHLAIDSGADIVWGHHAHVLQPIEEYNGGVIFYSLGNFVFGGNSAPKDFDTAIVQQEVIRQEDGSFTLGTRTIIPCSVSSISRENNYQPTPYAEGTKEYDRIISKLDGTYKGPNIPLNQGS